jgi:SAM-dependent methyltransferase
MTRSEPFEKFTRQYEAWFEKHRYAYESELSALRKLLPKFHRSVEIGVGSGRFAAPLGIKRGLEPSVRMGKIAKQRGIMVDRGVCENLPYDNNQFDLVLMVTTICFLDDIKQSLQEVCRILEPGGWFMIGFIDKDSSLGKTYRQCQAENVFYRVADFYSVEEIIQLLNQTGFVDFHYTQTIFHPLDEIKKIEPVHTGYGSGSFVVVRAQKTEDF